ncbi:MAG: YqaJ viral recombinase family protein, partial [Pseudomonadales bacterium]|nr:YqaJ viral recombinase family protein [Pseudomonadales bacterium]
EVQILECKTAGPWGSQRWAEGVPEDIQCQVQHQLAVTGKQAADVCVLLGGQQLKVFRVLRDELLIARLVKLERQFWRFVETDIPPPVDGSASCAEALSCLFPKDNGTAVDFSEDRSLCRTFQALRGVRDEMKPLQTAEAKLRQTLQQAMGEHSEAVFPEGRISWKRSQDSTRIDSKRLQAEEPLLAERFQVSVPGSRRFVLKD